MRNLLFVNSCVRDEGVSRTLELSKNVIDTINKDNKYNVVELNLNEMDIKPINKGYLSMRNDLIKNKEYESVEFSLARRFADADVIVIGAPYWDLSFPAILKNFIELICVCGITFKYGEGGEEIGLCKAKSLIYVTTSGGYIENQNFGYDYIKAIAKMVGIENTKFVSAEGLDIWENDSYAIMNDAKERVKELIV